MESNNLKAAWSVSKEAIIQYFQTDPEIGLDAAEVIKRQQQYGLNKIESKKKTSLFSILLSQFISPFVLLLAIAAGMSFFFDEWLDGIAIIAVIVINAIIGFFMEFQAERSMEALKKLTSVPAKVIREGVMAEIPSEALVPGDIMFVEGGDMVTADARIIQASQLQTDESALTGESLPVEKRPEPVADNTLLAERHNMVFKGTFVAKGNCRSVVVHTGMNTELGSVARLVQGANQAATPLEKKIQVFSKKLIWITVALIIIIFVAGLLNGQKFVVMLETSIALAVAAIPEGLPIVSTLALAFGMLRMARYNVIVKKLSSVETLGGTNVICTDKTGTLTVNKIEASYIQLSDKASRIAIDIAAGTTKWIDDAQVPTDAAYEHLCRISALCNTASYLNENGIEKETGDPLEIGLLKMIFASPKRKENYVQQHLKIDEIPFSSDTKVMATLHAQADGRYYIAAKGAAEELFAHCTRVLEDGQELPFTEDKQQHWVNLAEIHAQSGLRMLAFAYRNADVKESGFLNDLTLAGLIGFIDPPRQEVPAAIAECKSAGIKVVMITGDHPATAQNIALQLGLAEPGDKVMHGKDMKPYKELSESDKEQWLHSAVFARVSPEQKLDLITLFQEKQMVVGMTGDGVNDAPALKKADIGIAMGQRGTQVAQEVADMVLKDDAFSSIVLAVKQGRVIFDNIRKFVIFLLSCNLSELLIIATASVLNLHFQLFPLQILFINLITDVLPALALGVTEPAPHIMQRQPYSSDTPVIDRKRWYAIFAYSTIIAIITIGAVFASHELLHKDEKWNAELCNNILFYSLIFTQIFHVFNMSFEKGVRFYKTEVFRSKYVWYAVVSCIVLTLLSYWILPLRKVLEVSIYGWRDWSIVLIASLSSLLLIQIFKKLKLTI